MLLLRSFKQELELRRAFAESLAPRELAAKAASAFIGEIRSVLGTSPEPVLELPTIGTFHVMDYRPKFEPSNLFFRELSPDLLLELGEFRLLSDWNREFLFHWRIDPYYSEMPSPLSGFDLLNDAALIYLSRYFAEVGDHGFLELDVKVLGLAMCIHLHNVLLLHRDVKLESIGIFRESEFFASQELEKLVHVRMIADHPRAVGNRG